MKSWIANLIYDEGIINKLCSQNLKFMVALTKNNNLIENWLLQKKEGMTA